MKRFPEKHYSEQILDRLMFSYGWTNSTKGISVLKNVKGGSVGGQLNPTGVRTVFAKFDTDGRYLTLQSGFDDIFDTDCRGRDVIEVAKEFNDRTDAWAKTPAPLVKKPVIETEEPEEQLNVYGVANQPRLADNADDLYKKFAELSKSGVISDKGIIYPVAMDAGGGEFQINTQGKLERLSNGGMTSKVVTSSEFNGFHDDLERDMLTIAVKSNWGGNTADKTRRIVKILHSPRGNSFKDFPKRGWWTTDAGKPVLYLTEHAIGDFCYI